MSSRYPALEIGYYEITSDPIALNELNRLVSKHHTAATSTPVFHLCGQLVVGFDRPETTGTRLIQIIDRWSTKCVKGDHGRATPAQLSAQDGTAAEVAAGRPFR